MNPVSISEASRYPAAPSRVYLSRRANSPDPPDWVIFDAYGAKIDADDPAWVEYLKSRQKKAEKSHKRKNQPIEHVDIDRAADSMAELQREKLCRDVEKLEIGIAHRQYDLKQKSKDLIDFDLAECIFTTYLDSIEAAANQETENLRPRLRELLQQAIASGDAEAAATKITKAIRLKNERAIVQAKSETKQAIEQRRDKTGSLPD